LHKFGLDAGDKKIDSTVSQPQALNGYSR